MTAKERPWVLGAHIGTLLGYTIAFGSFLVPLFIWLSKRDESELIASHAKASLNFQLSMLVYGVIAAFLVLFIVGIPLLIVIAIVNVVCVILATIEADKGGLYKYPLTIEFIK
ncbi:MAG: DUF4870 domain-containing protein [Roseivirga sp.]